MTGNISMRSVGTEAAGRSEPKSPTPMGGASASEVLSDPPFTKKRCGKLYVWKSELEIAHAFAAEHGLRFELATAAYQVAKLIGADVRIVIYPHKTKSTGHLSLRVRDENSRNPDRADALMLALNDKVPGFNTFSRHLSDAGFKRHQAARQASNPTAEGV